MEKVKIFLNTMAKKLILYSTILTILVIIMHLFLKLINLRFRLWIYITTAVILVIAIMIKLVMLFIKQKPTVKRNIELVCGALITLGLIFWRVTLLLLFALLLLMPGTEHVVEKDGQKYVAYVNSGFLDTTVEYYDYINFFIMSNELALSENYNGSYDPIKRQKEENNIKIENEITTPNTEQSVNEEDIIYSQKIDDNISIRVIDRGNVMGQKKIIQIQKTINNGEKWKNQIAGNSMTINNEAKFVFINEDVGFINNLSMFILGNDNNSLLVTVNGGKSFKNANFIFPLDIEDTVFYINDLPYLEDGKLKVELFAPESIESTDGNYYKFTSIDNGLNWQLNKE